MHSSFIAALLFTTWVPDAAHAAPGVWTSAATAIPLGERQSRVALWADVHGRRSNAGFLSIVRPSIGVNLSDHWAVHGGYAWVVSAPDDGETALEHRAWEQVTRQDRALGGLATVQLRLRQEQRFHAIEDGVGHRLRTLARLTVQATPRTVGPVIHDELFWGFNDTSWGNRKGLTQNRAFLGVALPRGNGGRTEIGAMWLSIKGSDGHWSHEPLIFTSISLAPPVKRDEPSESKD